MSKIFINRPILATVIALVMVIAGLLAILGLPVTMYPDITPPTIMVVANYPGANAATIQTTVADPIEKEVNGVDNMIYMSSSSSNDGSYILTVTFEIGTDLDMATVLVQNRVNVAESSLPVDVTRLGVNTMKRSSNIVMLVAVTSDDPEISDLYLSNFAQLTLKDELTRVPGVSNIQVFGADEYSMRIWLDPGALHSLNLTPDEIVAAVQSQNIQVAPGLVGAAPTVPGQNFQYSLITEGQLKTEEEFGNIIIRADQERILRLKDVASLKLGASSYGIQSLINGKPVAMLGINQTPGANLVKVASDLRAKVEELSESFPKGVRAEITLDTSDYINNSIKEVVETMIIAIILVILSIYLFIQSIRATLIAAIAIPVSLIATFAVMLVIGFSINMFTLFALILAIGIVVDDAILVIENASRIIDQGYEPKAATIRCMEQITSAIIATTLVLLAVFVPSTMMGGITGEMFRQFAVVILVAVCFSSVNALTLSPALCAILLKPSGQKKQKGFFFWFDKGFAKTTAGYVNIVSLFVRKSAIVVVALIIFSAAAFFGFISLPTGFVPQEDQGYALAESKMPDGASFDRAMALGIKNSDMFSKMPGIKACVAIPGFSLLGSTTDSSSIAYFFIFDDFAERKAAKNNTNDLKFMMGQIYGGFGQSQEAFSIAFVPPSIPGLGATGGFSFMLEDRTGVGVQALTQTANNLIGLANTQTGLSGVSTMFRANTPQIHITADRDKIQQMGLTLSSVYNNMSILLGGYYINDFTLFDHSYKVKVQSDAEFRKDTEDFAQFYVRSPSGNMVPLLSLMDFETTFGPQSITRYNMYTAIKITGNAASGYSSGQAMAIMENVAKANLGESYGFDWTDLSFQEKRTSGNSIFILALSCLFGFLFLSANYESWLMAIAVMLSVPLAILGVVIGVVIWNIDINIYTQVGLVLLVGLAAKTAILIVEFASDLRHKENYSIRDAAVHAARLRFRPVLMTVISFAFGTAPLLFATGPSSVSRQAIGATVFFGLCIGTFFSVFMTPCFFAILQWISEHNILTGKKKASGTDLAFAGAAGGLYAENEQQSALPQTSGKDANNNGASAEDDPYKYRG